MAPSIRALIILEAIASHFLSLCIAQNTTGVPTSTSSAPAQTHTISVGIDHKFKPDVTQAEIGDIIDFQFFPPNHSVVRAEYEYPCIPYDMTGRGKVGFFSGFHPVDAILDKPPSWNITINDTNPIFLYCSAPGSCINYGMVAVINPNASTSLEHQRQLAKDSAYMLQPGDPFPPEGMPSGLSTTSSSSSSTAAPSMTNSSPAATSGVPAAASSSHSGLSTGAIAGIAVAATAIVCLAAALFFFIGRSRMLKREAVPRGTTAPLPPPSMYQHHSLLAPKSDMTDRSSQNSVLHQSGSPRYTLYNGECYAHVDGIGYSRGGTRSPVSDGGDFPSPRHTNSRGSVPQRYPSLALNPHDPREMSTSN